ncbi:MAG: hypothetical protein GX456_09320 [Verrucomicrobia bacterium]|nr:hypothetical protein [Verrucomicrobiota bacterium]
MLPPLLLCITQAASVGEWSNGGAIREPIHASATFSNQPNKAGDPKYIPAQGFAAYPERLKPGVRKLCTGITNLEPDQQKPIDGGVALLDGKAGRYTISYRRAGVTCQDNLRFNFRMELYSDLATMNFAIQVDGETFRLDRFRRTAFEIYPGMVHYGYYSDALKLGLEADAIAPASVPAYGMILRVRLHNDSDRSRDVRLIAVAASGAGSPGGISEASTVPTEHLKISCPRHKGEGDFGVLHDPNYTVLIGWDGKQLLAGTNALLRDVEIPARGEAQAQLTAFIDSPGYDEAEVMARVTSFFERNKNIPAQVRQKMAEDALDTFARIVANGDKNFTRVQNDGGASFAASAEAWKAGVYRQHPVKFELPDKKLESLANMAANDLFPSIIQPPGMVHDAKGGDYWNYIFCYRHVHAACDIGFEPHALSYLRLLSNNQKASGQVDSVTADFKTDGHPTRFEESYIDAMYHYYKWTGDLESLRQLYPTLMGAARWMDAYLDADGDNLYKDTMHQWKSDFDNRGPSSTFQTALVRKAYADLAEIAMKLGKAEDAAKFQAKSEAILCAAQRELWSDQFAMLGPKCPLGLLRLHPQSLEMEIPIWTQLTDPYQSAALTEWYLDNVTFSDSAGGLYAWDNDWWPLVWSQHLPAMGDMMMVGYAMMLSGRYDEGNRILQSCAAASARADGPGFNYVLFDDAVSTSNGDMATCLGAFFRALVEGTFGVVPAVDEGRITITPRFPSNWSYAKFEREGLTIHWRRDGETQEFTVSTSKGVRACLQIPVLSNVDSVTLNGKPVGFQMAPAMRHALVLVETDSGGGTVMVKAAPARWQIKSPETANPGQTVTVNASGLDSVSLDDRYRFLESPSVSRSGFTAKLARAGAGQSIVFLKCRTGNAEWIEPIRFRNPPLTARDAVKQTVLDPLPPGSVFVPVGLSSAYNRDIQSCFRQKWAWDAWGTVSDTLSFWSMPLFALSEPLPSRMLVGHVPFLLGSMGPAETKGARNLLMIANTHPHELPSGVRLDLSPVNANKLYLLSLNMHLPQKCYTPAAQVVLWYSDGSQAVTELIPPLNFDCYYQDCGINTAKRVLPAIPAYGMREWTPAFGIDLSEQHLTMTDIPCDATRKLTAIEIRSIATETFIGIAGLTLAVRAGIPDQAAEGAAAATQLQMADAIEHTNIVVRTDPDTVRNLAWLRKAKFGMFIHWGPAALSGGEISFARMGERRGFKADIPGVVPAEEYDRLYEKFNPILFDADQWVELAKDAGMRYMVFTAKHCDGFCMWDTQTTTYSITHTPFKRDVSRELAEACRRAGIQFNFYYSPADWRDPNYLTERHEIYVKDMHNQVRELLSNYGPQRVFWFDATPTGVDFRLGELYQMLQKLQPGILINDRGGMPGDFYTPESRVGKFDVDLPWESCIPLSGMWIWNPNNRPMPLKECIRLLVLTVGRGGNLLLNVGPRPDGTIEPEDASRLREIGTRLKKYGESIYDTTAGPWDMGPYASSTRRGATAYVHIVDWSEPVLLRDLGIKIKKAELLTGPGKVILKETSRGQEILVAEADRDPLDTIVKLTFERSVDQIKPSRWSSGSLAFGKKTSTSSVFRGYEGLAEGKHAVDDDYEWGWLSGRGERNPWLMVDLGRSETFDRACLIAPPQDPSVRAFVIEASDDGQTWHELLKGTAISGRKDYWFAPVTARYVRLRITETKEDVWTVRINEFQLFAPEKPRPASDQGQAPATEN